MGGGYTAPSACGLMSDTGGTIQPCGFPYWRMLLWGVEPVYRLMMQQQTIALARYIVTGPVRASAWDYTFFDASGKPIKGDDEPAIRWLKDNVLPLRRKVMRDAIRAVDYGWQPFAVTWEIRDGMYHPDVRPLLPDSTTVLQDDGGNFAGLENYGEKGGEPVRFNDLESWAPALDGEAGYAYGRSRLENVRTTAWAPWLNTVMRMRELESKLSGITPIVTHPPGGYVDDDGNYVNFATKPTKSFRNSPGATACGWKRRWTFASCSTTPSSRRSWRSCGCSTCNSSTPAVSRPPSSGSSACWNTGTSNSSAGCSARSAPGWKRSPPAAAPIPSSTPRPARPTAKRSTRT
jgi:hypothetical protein